MPGNTIFPHSFLLADLVNEQPEPQMYFKQEWCLQLEGYRTEFSSLTIKGTIKVKNGSREEMIKGVGKSFFS